MAKLVDALDLKSNGEFFTVPVRVRLSAPRQTTSDVVKRGRPVKTGHKISESGAVGSARALGARGPGFESRLSDKKLGGSSSVGRASPFQGEGRRFDPGLPLKIKLN